MEVIASAPGKVLITGGYLILERPNVGIVLSTTARFYAIVKPLYQEVQPESWVWSWTDVKVTSPQLSREATYKLSLRNSTLHCISSKDSTNPFVEQAVQYAFAAINGIIVDKDKKEALHKLLLQGLDITILGSNDFYSYRTHIETRGLPLTPEALRSLPPFASITCNTNDSNGLLVGGISRPEVAKTGLGSSAAMTTSVVAALLHYLGGVNLSVDSSTMDLDLVHFVAQTAHCIAQGKVGSGFDVSAAVYGSQRYIRFSPGILSSAQAVGGDIPDVITDILNKKWDHEKCPFSLPPLVTLCLGEPGSGGSSTPSMVGSMKQWQKSDPERSSETWRRLASANSMLEMQLNALSTLAHDHFESYKQIIIKCSAHAHGKWMEQLTDEYQQSVVKALLGARNAFIEIRSHMREMGKAAGVPIEPESQTRVLDATMDMEGVLLAGIPGAGGYDAIFAITLEGACDSLSRAWSSLGILPLLVREDPRGVALEISDPRTREVAAGDSSMHV